MKKRADMTCGHRNCEGRGTYTVEVACSNCGWNAWGDFTRGHEVSVERCPNCDVRAVRRRSR